MATLSKIDIRENILRSKGRVLDILLTDQTKSNKNNTHNIIWATDSYRKHGKDFGFNKCIKPELITGIYGKLIQPRAAKSLIIQKQRTKEKAEVFTPLKTVKEMNRLLDNKSSNFPVNKKNWQDYVKELRLEITCGEAPFIVSRYNPTSHTGKLIKIDNRVGFLDKKLHYVSNYCAKPKKWLFWAKEAYKASYGYEWQGDNLLIARENLLYTFIDYFVDKFNRRPSLAEQEEIAEIISWNIFQMDGLKYVVPMSCKHEKKVTLGELTIFGQEPDVVEEYECEGCKKNDPFKHNGKYAKIMDWKTGKVIKFVSLLENK